MPTKIPLTYIRTSKVHPVPQKRCGGRRQEVRWKRLLTRLSLDPWFLCRSCFVWCEGWGHLRCKVTLPRLLFLFLLWSPFHVISFYFVTPFCLSGLVTKCNFPVSSGKTIPLQLVSRLPSLSYAVRRETHLSSNPFRYGSRFRNLSFE